MARHWELDKRKLSIKGFLGVKFSFNRMQKIALQLKTDYFSNNITRVMEDRSIRRGKYRSESFTAGALEADKRYFQESSFTRGNNCASSPSAASGRNNLEDIKGYIRERTNSLTSSLRKKYLEFSKDIFSSQTIISSSDDSSNVSSISKQLDRTPDVVEKICALDVGEFLQKFSGQHLKVFYRIVGEPKINLVRVHAAHSQSIEGGDDEKFFDLFCKFFSTKYACNLKRIGCFDYLCNETTAVFPILLLLPDDNNIDATSEQQKHVGLEIVDMLDEQLLNDVNKYLERYYLRRDDILKEVKHLLFLISTSETYHPGLHSLLTVDFLAFNRRNYIVLLQHYMLFYCMCLDNGKYAFYDLDNCQSGSTPPAAAATSDNDDPLSKKLDNDLRLLAESYRLYECYYRDIFDILVDIFNVTLFHYKLSSLTNEKFDDDDTSVVIKYNTRIIDKSCLRDIGEYLKDKHKKCSENVKFVIHPVSNEEQFFLVNDNNNYNNNNNNNRNGDRIDNCYLWADAHLLVDDALIDFTYSSTSKNKITDFYKLILSATMISPDSCNKLIIYNARLGEETSIDMIRNVDEIKQFVRLYRTW